MSLSVSSFGYRGTTEPIILLPDGRMYIGQLRQNQRHGKGKMEVVENSGGKKTKTVFDGQWKCDKFEGHGTILYSSGDVYKGSVKVSLL